MCGISLPVGLYLRSAAAYTMCARTALHRVSDGRALMHLVILYQVTMEAINLSINFWFITPIVFPSMAPVIHPTLEALFNIVRFPPAPIHSSHSI